MQYVTLALGGAFTFAGAAGLVLAHRAGQAGQREVEQRRFAWSVASLALGSLGFLATVTLTG